MEETLRSQLLNLCRTHGKASGLAPGTIGKAALRDHTFFARVEKGEGGFNIRTFDKVVRWFADNWPADAQWPADVPRPERGSNPEAAVAS